MAKRRLTYFFAVDNEVVVTEGEPALLEVIVSRLIVVRHLGDRGLRHLSKREEGKTTCVA